MADSTRQQQDNKDAQSGEPVQLDKEQGQGEGKPEQQDPGNEAGGMKQGAEPQHEGGQKR
jgi:hypothetical protein